MKRTTLFFGCALFASTHLAYATTNTNSSTTTPSIDRVMSVVNADFTDDGLQDRAILVNGATGSGDLYLYEGQDTNPDTPMKLVLFKSGLVWVGNMWGTWPELRLNGRNSLQVVSQNDAIGRNRWQEIITVSRRDGLYKVSGYTRYDRDTLDPEAGSSCDINFLNGRASINKVAKTHTQTVQALGDWVSETPKLCSGKN